MHIHLALTLIAYLASAAVWVRFRPYLRPRKATDTGSSDNIPGVSVVIPTRNEADNISALLESLITQQGVHEVIVVDDQSTDNTRKVAERFPVTVLDAGPRPEGWGGKTWACHVGSRAATGQILLFTDADVVYRRSGILQATKFLRARDADMISSYSYHLNKLWWEKILGPFFCLIHAGASPYDKPRADAANASGQFIMIKAECYQRIGGHASVRGALAEDSELVSRVLRNNGRYMLYRGPHISGIQMYGSFADFVNGWTRIMRLGMNRLSFEIALNSFVPLLALNVFNLSGFQWFNWLPTIATLLSFALVQRKLGNFSILGVILFPVSVGLFVVVGTYATLCEWFRVPIVWRGRVYRSTG